MVAPPVRFLSVTPHLCSITNSLVPQGAFRRAVLWFVVETLEGGVDVLHTSPEKECSQRVKWILIAILHPEILHGLQPHLGSQGHHFLC